MNKLTYKLTHKQACCLRDIAMSSSTTNLPVTTCKLLAASVAIEFALSLSRKLLVVYSGERRINISYPAALALAVLCGHVTLDKMTPLQLAVLLPIIQDVDKKIVQAK